MRTLYILVYTIRVLAHICSIMQYAFVQIDCNIRQINKYEYIIHKELLIITTATAIIFCAILLNFIFAMANVFNNCWRDTFM